MAPDLDSRTWRCPKLGCDTDICDGRLQQRQRGLRRRRERLHRAREGWWRGAGGRRRLCPVSGCLSARARAAMLATGSVDARARWCGIGCPIVQFREGNKENREPMYVCMYVGR